MSPRNFRHNEIEGCPEIEFVLACCELVLDIFGGPCADNQIVVRVPNLFSMFESKFTFNDHRLVPHFLY